MRRQPRFLLSAGGSTGMNASTSTGVGYQFPQNCWMVHVVKRLATNNLLIERQLSNANSCHICVMSIRACVVERPQSAPNCHASNLFVSLDIIHRPTNDSSTLLKVGMSYIGLKSSWIDFGGWDFGIGTIYVLFHSSFLTTWAAFWNKGRQKDFHYKVCYVQKFRIWTDQ
jgi:hypothetical protein